MCHFPRLPLRYCISWFSIRISLVTSLLFHSLCPALGRSLLLMGARTTAPLTAPLISLIPAAHVAVVPSYSSLLVCIVSICDRIVSIFCLSFNMHSKKNTNELVLRDNIVFHLNFSAAQIGPRHRIRQPEATRISRPSWIDLFCLVDVG